MKKKPMTLEIFLKKFKKAVRNNGQAILKYGMCLRFKEKGLRGEVLYCPITLVCDKELGLYHSPMFFIAAADELGLPRRTAELIAGAADGPGQVGRATRSKLLKIAGFQEEAKMFV